MSREGTSSKSASGRAMSHPVRVPALPESVADATVVAWHKKPGEAVRKDENLVDLETDKVVLEVPAPADGVLGAIEAETGAVVQAEAILALIEAPSERSEQASPPQAPGTTRKAADDEPPAPVLAPAARRLVKELDLNPRGIPGSGKDGRVQKADVVAFLDALERSEEARADEPRSQTRGGAQPAEADAPTPVVPEPPRLTGEAGRPEQRVTMTRLRARIAERLVEAQQTAAILTTFNEVDMTAVLGLRNRYKDQFEETHGVRLGLMSFFVKAAVEALQRFPVINASVDGADIIYHGYYDIGMAVSSPRGLVVPILRNCDRLTMADIEQGILDFGRKAKDGTLSYEELTGGTFSITNGGVFGSLLSTPILNPPQSAILGMHKVQDRPVVVEGAVVVRPMMYLALSYDHRIVDGRDAVQFLVTIKDTLEDPARLLMRI